MVGPPRRATHAAAAETGPACASPTPAHDAPAAQPAYWLAQRAAPAGLAPRPRTAPRAPPAVGQRLLDARRMLLPVPNIPPASGECLRGPIYKREVDSSTGNSNKYLRIAGTVAWLGSHYTARSRLPRCDSGAHTPPRDSPRTSIYPQNTPIFFDASLTLCSLRPLARLVHPSPCV